MLFMLSLFDTQMSSYVRLYFFISGLMEQFNTSKFSVMAKANIFFGLLNLIHSMN